MSFNRRRRLLQSAAPPPMGRAPCSRLRPMAADARRRHEAGRRENGPTCRPLPARRITSSRKSAPACWRSARKPQSRPSSTTINSPARFFVCRKASKSPSISATTPTRPNNCTGTASSLPAVVDGAAEEGTPYIPPHSVRRVSFTPGPSGFRFYHSHLTAGTDLSVGAYTGLAGPVYIDSPETEPRRL